MMPAFDVDEDVASLKRSSPQAGQGRRRILRRRRRRRLIEARSPDVVVTALQWAFDVDEDVASLKREAEGAAGGALARPFDVDEDVASLKHETGASGRRLDENPSTSTKTSPH